MSFDVYILPVLVFFVTGYAFLKKIPVFDCFMSGAKKGLKNLYEILPSITGLVIAVTMLTESSAGELIGRLLSPITSVFGIPEETVPLALLSPVSGGGAITVFESILSEHGADSFAGRVASVMMGSTETTFYAVTVYFAAVSIKNTRHTLYAGLAADFTAFVLASFFVRLFLGG